MSKYTMIKPGAWLTEDRKVVVLKANDADRIVNAMPPGTVTVAEYQGAKLVALPYHMHTIRLLRNLGYRTDGMEILRHTYQLPKVEGVFPLAQHQVAQAAFFTENPRAFCTSTMRTGKTASAIVAARFLQEHGMATGTLIIATVSNLVGVWQKEINGLYPQATVKVLYGDKNKRRELLAQDADFYVINYDGVKLLRDELGEAVDSGRINVCIVDELTHYANTHTQLWEAAHWVINGARWEVIPGKTMRDGDRTWKTKDRKKSLPGARGVEYCWGLTGTPGDPEMVYGEIKIIRPERMSFSFTQWRDGVCIKKGFKWIPREDHKKIIHMQMQPCIRYDKKDIMDLPPVVMSGRECDLSVAQKKVYRQLQRDMLAMVGDATVRAVTKSVVVSKLLQVASGVVITDKGTASLDMQPRLDVMEEIIRDATQKVVVFCAFTAVIDRLYDELTARGHSVGVVDGRVTGAKRDEIFRIFQEDPNTYQIILCHPRTTAFGVELAAADTMVFFGPPLSGEFVYQQAIERMSSLKQKAASCQIIHLSSTWEERQLFSSIRKGVSINEAINAMFTRKVY
ncbi:TPA: DEAD/DEAH box helicase [Escherichia coli]|nr:DEAD/DEAH box helicase [Escherichia coli]